MAVTTAHAQIASDEFGIERFRLSPDESSILDVNSAEVGPHRAITGGLALGFAHEPLVIYDSAMNAVDPLVERRLTTDLVASISLWDRLQVGLGADIIGYQSGVDGLTLDKLPSGGIGDFRMMTKVVLVDGVAFAPTLIVPAGSAGGWLREAGVSFAPEVAISRARGRVRGAVNLGYRFRPRVEVAGLVADDEGFARVGIAGQVGRGEVWWSTSLAAPVTDRRKNVMAIEMLVGGTQRVTSLVNVFAAGGVGLDNGFGVPDWRALAGVRFVREERVAHLIVKHEAGPPPPPPVAPIVVEPAPPPPAKLSGTIATATGEAIPGATITIDTDAGPVEVIADDDGKFAAEVPGKLGKLHATAPGYDAGEVEIVVENGVAQVNVSLKRSVRSGQLRGQVLSFNGKPLAATIRVGDQTTTADADGQYSIDLPAGAFQVTIEADGYVTQKRNVKVKLDGVTVLNVDLRGGK
jgi:hypothetical protein